MADQMEEIRFISSILEFSFSHVNRECNVQADFLTKDGASHISLVFDV